MEVKVDVAVLNPKAGNSGSLEAEFLLLQETWVFALKAFKLLDEAYPHYGGYSAFLKTFYYVNHI